MSSPVATSPPHSFQSLNSHFSLCYFKLFRSRAFAVPSTQHLLDHLPYLAGYCHSSGLSFSVTFPCPLSLSFSNTTTHPSFYGKSACGYLFSCPLSTSVNPGRQAANSLSTDVPQGPFITFLVPHRNSVCAGGPGPCSLHIIWIFQSMRAMQCDADLQSRGNITIFF